MATTTTPDRGAQSPAGSCQGAKDHFWRRTAYYASLGYDRLAAVSFILDEAGPLVGPVLDVGTGMGITARALASRGLDVVSVDMNADNQQVAVCLTEDPTVLRHIRFTLANAASLPFADAQFGSVVTVDALHHLDDGAAVLTEVVRVLRPGGVVVLSDFSRDGFNLVARVHASEGRLHPEGPVKMAWASNFLCAMGLDERAAFETHLHHVSVLQTASA